MPSAVENIFQNYMADPNFELGKPVNERRENAWRLAWDRYHQTQRNNVALSMAKEEKLAKESVGTMGPDSGSSKYPAKIGGPTTIENTKKFGQERINLHKDPNRTWRTRPETATEMTTDKDLEALESERIRREAGFSKMEKEKMLKSVKLPKPFKGQKIIKPENIISIPKPKKQPKSLMSTEVYKPEKWEKDFLGKLPVSKQDQFKAYLKKHLTDTLDEKEFQPQEQEMHGEENADSKMMSDTTITIDTIIDALTELKNTIGNHELDEMTGQEEDGLELFESLEKHDRKQPHYHPYSETGPGIDVESYRKPQSLLPKGQKVLLDPSVKKHYTDPGGKHEHLETGQWVRPGMKTVPGKTWGGKVLAKKNFKDLDFKDQSAVMQEAKLFAQGKLKKPVVKQIDSRGKSGTFNIQGAAPDKPILAPKSTRAPKLSSMTDAEKAEYYKPIPVETVKKHEDYSMHRHAGKDEKYPFLSHILPPPKIKTEPVKKTVSEKDSPAGWISNKPAASKKESQDFTRNYPFVKDTSSINEITEVQKKGGSRPRIPESEKRARDWGKQRSGSGMTEWDPIIGRKAAATRNIARPLTSPKIKKDAGKIKNVFAVATEAARKAGYSDFSEDSPGKEKRGEIAEALKRQEGIKKDVLQKLLFTIKRGKVKSSSVPQHRLLHGRELDHTHIEGGKYKREKLEKEAQKTLYNVLSNRKYAAPDTLSSAPITTGVTRSQLRVE